MSNDEKILSMGEINTKSPTTKIVTLPDLSAEIGEPVRAKISKIAPEDLLSLYDFPMDEVNRAIATSEDSEKEISKMASEQWEAFSLADQLKMIRSLVLKSLVEPTPPEEFMARLTIKDLNFIGGEIIELSNPKKDAEAAGRFPANGERGSD